MLTKLMTCLQMCSISSMVRLLGIVFPISVFFSMSGSGLHDGEPWPIEMLTFVENLRTVAVQIYFSEFLYLLSLTLDDHPEQEEEAGGKDAADEEDEVGLGHGDGGVAQHLGLLLTPRRQCIDWKPTFIFPTRRRVGNSPEAIGVVALSREGEVEDGEGGGGAVATVAGARGDHMSPIVVD